MHEIFVTLHIVAHKGDLAVIWIWMQNMNARWTSNGLVRTQLWLLHNKGETNSPEFQFHYEGTKTWSINTYKICCNILVSTITVTNALFPKTHSIWRWCFSLWVTVLKKLLRSFTSKLFGETFDATKHAKKHSECSSYDKKSTGALGFNYSWTVQGVCHSIYFFNFVLKRKYSI